jgi:hypothetical protein
MKSRRTVNAAVGWIESEDYPSWNAWDLAAPGLVLGLRFGACRFRWRRLCRTATSRSKADSHTGVIAHHDTRSLE